MLRIGRRTRTAALAAAALTGAVRADAASPANPWQAVPSNVSIGSGFQGAWLTGVSASGPDDVWAVGENDATDLTP